MKKFYSALLAGLLCINVSGYRVFAESDDTTTEEPVQDVTEEVKEVEEVKQEEEEPAVKTEETTTEEKTAEETPAPETTTEEVTEEVTTEEAVKEEVPETPAADNTEKTEEQNTSEEEKPAAEPEVKPEEKTEEKTEEKKEEAVIVESVEGGTETTEGGTDVTEEVKKEEEEEKPEVEEEEVEEDELEEVPFVPADTPTAYGFVTRMYQTVLGRDPDSKGYAEWTLDLTSGKKTAADIVHGFFFSQEYLRRQNSDADIVKDYYKAMLNRAPDEGGANYWERHLHVGMTMDAISAGFVDSSEFKALCDKYKIKNGKVEFTNYRDTNFERTSFVYRLYMDCLDRKPDLEGLEDWCKRLAQGETGSTVAHGFVFSKEYKDQAASNDEYINMLYQTIMGRNPDAEGKLNWLTAVNYYMSRERAFNGFLTSQEFYNKCKVADIKQGGYISEPDSSKAWLYNIQFLNVVNQRRRSNGVADVTLDESLWENIAMNRAQEISQCYSSKYRPNGKPSWIHLYWDYQYAPGRADEAICRLVDSVEAAVAYMETPGIKDDYGVSIDAIRSFYTDTAIRKFAAGYYTINGKQYFVLESADKLK